MGDGKILIYKSSRQHTVDITVFIYLIRTTKINLSTRTKMFLFIFCSNNEFYLVPLKRFFT